MEPVHAQVVMPRASRLWSRAVIAASVIVLILTIERIFQMLGNLWLLESIGFESVFWTNFSMGTKLYLLALVLYSLAALVPTFVHDLSKSGRAWLGSPGFLLATVAALVMALQYESFLFGSADVAFGKTDPVFGRDLGFFVFDLPNYWILWKLFLGAALLFTVSSAAAAFVSNRDNNGGRSWYASLFSTPTRVGILLTGLIAAFGVHLARFGLVTKDNIDSAVYLGAEYIDVTGLFSNINFLRISALAVLVGAVVVFLWLGGNRSPLMRRLVVAVIAVPLIFRAFVQVRDEFFVQPNEPVVQLPYIERHIEATREAFGLDGIEEVDYRPNSKGDPIPDVETILASDTVKNTPLWPGFTNYLEKLLDPQHAERILLTGDPKIYGPTLDRFRQNQKLRSYYNFLNVDNLRYTIDGEKKMFVSTVRELPLFEPVPWLNYWGQRYMLFTHGYGLVMASANEVTDDGGLVYASFDIPSRTTAPQLDVANERIYYGEGTSTMAFSDVRDVSALDYPTDQDRAVLALGSTEDGGIVLDSLLKRVVLGWMGGRLIDFVFSDLITDETRVHYQRQPIQRLQEVAPFIYYDTNPYAVATSGSVVWMVNGMTTTNDYPYSMREELGDKSDERSLFPGDNQWVNYIEDSVKATVDAATGKLTFFKRTSDPIVDTWESIYPELFTDFSEMSDELKKQITFPVHLMHLRFDDLFIYYHMADPMYFFNLEDMWDDADEVLGPVLDNGKAINFSIEPHPLLLETGGALPESSEALQYAAMMVFTPEKAMNLRAVPIVYQDGEDYGRSIVLQVPKGTYIMGPEQADAIIDQTPEISQNFSWWNRRGVDVVRGHTQLLPVGNELLYVEPIFLRSQQNPATQLKKVAVVYREEAVMADTLEEAIRMAVAKARERQYGGLEEVTEANTATTDAAPAS